MRLWLSSSNDYDDVIKWKHFPRYWPFVRETHRSPVNSPHKGQWRGALMSSLICASMNDWVNNREAGDLRRHRTHFDVTEMMNCVARTVPSILFLKMEAIHVSSQRPQISHNRSTLLRHYITEQFCVLSLHTIRYIPYLISSLLLYRTDIKIFLQKKTSLSGSWK